MPGSFAFTIHLFHLLQGGPRGLPGASSKACPPVLCSKPPWQPSEETFPFQAFCLLFHVVGLTCTSPPRLLLPRSPPRSLSLPLSPAQACPGGIHPQVPVPRPLTRSLLSPDPCPGSPSFLLTWITEPIFSLAPLQSPFLLPVCPPHCCQAEL